MARPIGVYGEVATALLREAGRYPGTVRELAERACVGYRAARYTVSRLAAAGRLVEVGRSRPAVYALADPAPPVERVTPGAELVRAWAPTTTATTSCW